MARDEQIAIRQPHKHMAGHVSLKHAGNSAGKRARRIARHPRGQHMQRHIFTAANSLNPRLFVRQTIAGGNPLQAQQGGDQRGGGEHAPHLEMDRRRRIAAQPKPAMFLWQIEHQPAHFGDQLP